MHRIDGAGATVDNKFTEGDPVGGVQATVVTAPWLNDMQEELMSLLAAASVAPVKGTQDQVLRSIRKISAGIVGQVRNLKCSIPTASASANLTADEIIVETALGGLRYCLASFNKSINLASIGAGGMDIGTAPVNGYVAIYAILNASTGATALLGVNATSAAAPNVYGGANMPAGYTASALVSVLPTNASGLFKIAKQRDRRVSIPLASALSTAAVQASFVPLSISGVVPPNATGISGELVLSNTGTASMSVSVGSDASGTGQQNVSAVVQAAIGTSNNYTLDLDTSQQMYYTATSTGGTSTFAIFIASYTF